MVLSTRASSYTTSVDTLDPDLFVTLVTRDIVGRYVQICLIALLVYETIITTDKEVEYFWGKFFNLRKPITIVYFANRYLVIVGQVAALMYDRGGVAECKPSIATPCLSVFIWSGKFGVWTSNLSNWVNIISLDYILMIRVLALYHHDKRLRFCLASLLSAEATFRIFVTFFFCLNQDYIIIPVEGTDISLCMGPYYIPISLVYLDWILPMLYGLSLLFLAVIKAREYWKLSAGFEGFKLVKVLIRDQAVYFVLAVSCCIFNIMQFKVTNGVLSLIFQVSGSIPFLSILGSRLLFNLKEAGKYGFNEGTNYRPQSTMDMEFVQPLEMEMKV